MYGYDLPDEILSLRTTLDLISPKDRAFSTNQEARLKRTPAPTHEEYRGIKKDGILRDEAFIQKCLERHINPKGHFERTFSDGKTYQICEFKTQSGGVVIFRIDVTEQCDWELKRRVWILRCK